MKINPLTWLKPNEGETIATFGQARLVKHVSEKIAIVGGTEDDRTAANEWASLCLHEAAI